MTPDIDPIARPSEYRELLLSLLGGDDAAEAQASAPSALRQVLAEAGDRLTDRPAEREWSILELLGHITDAELVCSVRYRWILAHDRPELAPYDQDLWVSRLEHGTADPDDLLGVFEPLREANVALWRRTPEEDRERFGIHAERGRETYDVTFRMLAGHDRFHLDQMRRTLATVRTPTG